MQNSNRRRDTIMSNSLFGGEDPPESSIGGEEPNVMTFGGEEPFADPAS